MKALVQEKERAIELRKRGLCYRDILKEVNVAKSSLSVWLKDLPLTKNEKYALKRRKDTNITRGRIKAAGILSQRRLEREAKWLSEAKQVFTEHSNNPFFHAGIIHSLRRQYTSRREKVSKSDLSIKDVCALRCYGARIYS